MKTAVWDTSMYGNLNTCMRGMAGHPGHPGHLGHPSRRCDAPCRTVQYIPGWTMKMKKREEKEEKDIMWKLMLIDKVFS